MFDVLPVPLPWYVVGPLMGLLVAGLYAVTNNHLGISGAYVQFVDRARGRQLRPGDSGSSEAPLLGQRWWPVLPATRKSGLDTASWANTSQCQPLLLFFW
jgi:hypothetical protein